MDILLEDLEDARFSSLRDDVFLCKIKVIGTTKGKNAWKERRVRFAMFATFVEFRSKPVEQSTRKVFRVPSCHEFSFEFCGEIVARSAKTACWYNERTRTRRAIRKWLCCPRRKRGRRPLLDVLRNAAEREFWSSSSQVASIAAFLIRTPPT